MKFHKLEKINLRNETRKYLSGFVNFNKYSLVEAYMPKGYNLYYGTIKDFFGIVICPEEILDEIIFKNEFTCVKFDNNEIQFDNNKIYDASSIVDELCDKIEKSPGKSIELLSNEYYIKFPVSLDLIDWLKAEIEIMIETKEIYKKISLPYINSIYDKNTKWIYDLVYNYSEESMVLFRSNDIVICKDIVWKDIDTSQFYILCIPSKKIKSIRNLTQQDIPLLKSMKDKAIEIAEQYGISKNKLYMFFHYHPSYYQLHLHVCITEHESLETKYHRHYYLDDIINQLESDSDYLKKAILKFELLTNTKLYKLLKV